MPRNSSAALVLTLFSFFSLASFAQAPPSADAYITTAQPSTTFGSSSLLPVQAGTTSYVRLNLSALPANASIVKATLRLYVNAVVAPGSFDVYEVNGSWSEKGITASNAPALGASATGNQPILVTAASLNQFILIDITALAQGWLNGSIPNYGVALALTSGGGTFSFDSKESIGTGHQPELDVVFGGTAGTPTASVLRSSGAVSTAQRNLQAPSDPYIDNGTASQIGASFNIDGSGAATSFNAMSQFLLAGNPVLGSNGTSSLFVGPSAGQSNTGSQNTFIGVSAGQANTTGSALTFLGTQSGLSNTTGSALTFLGANSGLSNTTGNYNSFIGVNSGYSNTTGSYNSFMGNGSGRSNTTGSLLTFLGLQSGYGNTTGSWNSFVGTYSGFSNTTGGSLTFLGVQSGYSNSTGNYNSFMGVNSGYSNTTGSYNSFIGNGSGRANTTGSYLTFLGLQSGLSNTTGNYNSFVGTYSGSSNTAGSFNTFLGFNAGLNADPAGNNNIYISSLGAPGDNGAIRIGDPANQSVAYIAGIAGSSTKSGVPVFVDSTGKLGTGGGAVNFTQVTGTLTSPQLSGSYTNSVTLSNSANSFAGTFAGDGASLIGVSSGLSWPIVTKFADYAIQTTDFSTPTSYGNFVVLSGSVSHTFTLPNPPPPNGSCVAIGNVAGAGINSGTNVYLSVAPNGLNVDATATFPTHPRRVAYLYCSDGTGYYRLGYNQNGVSEIGPWLKTVDTGTVNALTTTFRNGMDFGLVPGTMFYILPVNNNTTSNPTLNVNGLGAKRITKFGNQTLAPNDLTTTAYAHVFYDGTNWQLLNPQTNQGTVTSVTTTAPLASSGGTAPTISCPTCVTTPTLSGTTGSIGGSALTAGSCTTGTATVPGATVGHPVSVSASDGTLPSGLIILRAAVTSPSMVTVQLCGIASVTPAPNTYNVATQ